MQTTHRPYADEEGDFLRLCRFITDPVAHPRSRSTWCLGRFVDWRYGLWGAKLDEPRFWERNGHLWLDPFGGVAGIALSEDGGPEFTVETGAGYRFLYPQMVDWVLENWGNRGRPATELAPERDLEARELGRLGFVPDWDFATCRYDLTAGPSWTYPLPDGFRLVDMAGQPNYRAQHILRSDAFHGGEPAPEALAAELALDARSRLNPIYHAATDLCVEAPDGSFASGCEALLDARNCEAEIERVCTHTAHRGRGLARGVLGECLRRLREMGYRSAYLTGYSPEAMGLYVSLEPAERWENTLYRASA
jgi:GNAT superfamily N-acetyltransferase